jgi:hypothetical protein
MLRTGQPKLQLAPFSAETPRLDHLVGAQRGRFRDRQPERILGLEIDDQHELGRSVYW